jgi:hypothetical protein
LKLDSVKLCSYFANLNIIIIEEHFQNLLLTVSRISVVIRVLQHDNITSNSVNVEDICHWRRRTALEINQTGGEFFAPS